VIKLVNYFKFLPAFHWIDWKKITPTHTHRYDRIATHWRVEL